MGIDAYRNPTVGPDSRDVLKENYFESHPSVLVSRLSKSRAVSRFPGDYFDGGGLAAGLSGSRFNLRGANRLLRSALDSDFTI